MNTMFDGKLIDPKIMVVRITLIFTLFICSVQFGTSQTPEIKWWFDMLDASYGSAAAADVDEDGKLEIIFSCYRRDSSIYVLNGEDGSLLWKRNLAQLPSQGCNDVAPIISDVDLDGHLEIIIPASCNPRTFCLDGKTGAIEWVTLVHGSDSPPTIADIDEDGKPEILHGGFGGYITCLNGEDGSIFWDKQIEPEGSINGEIIVLDADNNGTLDIVTSSWNFTGPSKIKCFTAKDLVELWTFSEDLAPMYHGPSFADLDGDNLMELVVSTQEGKLYMINAEDGSKKWEFEYDQAFHNSIYATSIADLNNDGKYEISFFDYGTAGVISSEGEELWSNDIGFTEIFRGSSISDINGDDQLDLVFAGGDHLYALNGIDGSEHWKMNLHEHDGRPLFSLDHGALIADFDNDGILDIFVTGGYGISHPTIENNFGRAYCISTGGSGGPDWLMFRRDSVRSGTVPLDIQTSVKEKHGFSNHFIVSPNPTSGMINIVHNENIPIQSVEIFNSSGQKMIVSTSTMIDISALISGVYFVQLTTRDHRIYYQKVVLQAE